MSENTIEDPKNDSNNFMINSLARHLFFSKILPLLPIESSSHNYQEVENGTFYLSCRSVAFNITVHRNLNPVVKNSLDLIDYILQDEPITSNKLNEDSMHSILVVVRLLSDLLEFYWDCIESRTSAAEFDPTYTRQKKFFKGSAVGFSTHRPSFHSVQPEPIDPPLITRLLETCTRIKFNTRLLSVLKGMAPGLFGPGSSTLTNILPIYQKFLKDKNFPYYTAKIDLTVDYILKFAAAANPKQYHQFLNSKVSHVSANNINSTSELGIVRYLDFFGCMFLTDKTLAHFLETIKSMATTMKRNALYPLLLYYAGKAVLFWIMARPEEYIYLAQKLQHINNETTPHYVKTIPHLATCMFDDVYSHFNISGILTSTTEFASEQHLAAHNQPHSSSTAGNNGNATYQPIHHPSQASTPVGGDVSRTLHHVASHASGHSSAINSIEDRVLVSPVMSSNFSPSSFISETKSISRDIASSAFQPPMSFFNEPPATPSETSHVFPYLSMEDTPVSSLISNINSLDNILELYTNLHSNELLSYSTVLRFLSILLFLDPDTFPEINFTSFKNIPDVSDLSDFTVKTKTMRHSGSTNGGDKEKSQSIKQFRHSLKKLTTLPGSKKSRQVKFLTLLIKNLNGSQVACDVAFIDSLKTLLSILTMSSSVSLHNQQFPCVVFSKRIYKILGNNFDVGRNWAAPTNNHIKNCLTRNAKTKKCLQLEFFAAGLQLDPTYFLQHLDLEKELDEVNLEKLSIYTEGFRIFFHLLEKNDLRIELAKKTSDFFKTLFCTVADILLKDFPYFDDKVTNIVSSILDGSILEKFDKTRSLSNINESAAGSSEVGSLEVCSAGSLTRRSTSSKGSGRNVPGSWDVEEVLPSIVSADNSTDFHKNLPDDDSIDTPFDINKLIVPNAKRRSASMPQKRFISLSSPTDLEKNRFSPSFPGTKNDMPNLPTSLAHHFPTHMHSSMPKTLKSPKQKNDAARRLSDEKLSKFASSTKASLRQLQEPIHNPGTPSRENHKLENDHARNIMMNIFSIFKRLTKFFILPNAGQKSAEWVSRDFKNIIKPIFVAIMDKNKVLQNSAQSFMDILVNYMSQGTEDIEKDKLYEFYILSSYTVSLFAATLFDLKISNAKREILLGVVVKVLKLRLELSNSAIVAGIENGIVEIDASVFPIVAITVGGGLFVSLFCNDGNVPIYLREGYKHFYEAIQFYETYVDNVDETCLYNIEFIKVMSLDTYASSGSVAFQRKLKNNILKYISFPDSILLDAMSVLFRKWSAYTQIKYFSQRELTDFRNIAGILAAISGVIMSKDCTGLMELNDYPLLKVMRKDLIVSTNEFIKQQCEWLNNSELITRENSRDLLSIELHPMSFGLLFENLKIKINMLEKIDISDPNQESNFVLLEQIIIILKTILLRDDDEHVLILFSPHLVNSIDDLIGIVEKIDDSSIRYYKSIIQMSKMFKALQHCEVNLGLKHHFKMKNKWMKLVINWFESTITRTYDFENLSKSHREMDLKKRDMDFLFIDTSIESSKALAYLTEGVPLEVQSSNTKDEMDRSTTVVFGKYFTILLKGLEKSTSSDKFPVTLKHKINLLNGNLILSLTNLSNSNVDASFKFTLPMGYSSNKNIKIAFLKVFIDIVTNYPQKTEMSEKKQIEAMDKLILLLIEHPRIAFQGSLMCKSSEIDAYAAGLVNGFETRNAGHVVVKELIINEIECANEHLDVLRRNSCATRALSLYARIKGCDYLVKLLRPILQELVDTSDNFDIEKTEPEGESNQSIEMFLRYLDKLSNAILDSLEYFPPELRLITHAVYVAMKEKFPEYAHIAVGTFVFLRFIGPALVSPESENIILTLPLSSKKAVIALAKVVQNMANGSDNFEKWEILSRHASVLKEHTQKIHSFIVDLCEPNVEIYIPIRFKGPPIVFDYHFLHRFLYLQELNIRTKSMKLVDSAETFEKLKILCLDIDDILGELGLPLMELTNDLPVFVKENMDRYPELYEYMNRHAFKQLPGEDESHAVMPVYQSMSPTGVPILIISFQRIDPELRDVENVVYSLLQIYAKLWTNQHYILMDCTGFRINVSNFKKLCKLFFSLTPIVAVKNCIKVYYLNPTELFMTSWLAQRGKENLFSQTGTQFEFINTSSDQSLLKSLGLSTDILETLQNTRISLHDIHIYNEARQCFCPISLKIGYTQFQVLHEEPRSYTLDEPREEFDVMLNDVFSFYDVLSVAASNVTGDENEFTVNFYDDTRLIFSSPKHLEIVKMFYYAESKLETEFYDTDITYSQTQDKKKKQIDNRNEIIGHLCLVFIVGLFNEDDTVKNISFNLLVATQEAFKLDLGTKFYQSAEIYVPSNTTTFLVLVTEALSTSFPELTPYIWKFMIDGLESHIVPNHAISTIVTCLSYWIPNLYQTFFITDNADNPELASHVVQTLIRLTLQDSEFTAMYLQQIWFKLALDNRLTSVLVDEIINHAMERDSENKDWTKVITLLTGFATVEVASELIKKLMKMMELFLPSLKAEIYSHSWSELTILSKISVALFFEAPLLAQMFLPELLFIISLLIDVGPPEFRLTLHELLMNVCHSLTINESLSPEFRKNLIEISTTFSHQKLNAIVGFSQDKGRLTPALNATSFTSKVNSLENFTANVIMLMENSSESEASLWKTKFKKYILDSIFNFNSFLSARAMMIIGIMGKQQTSELLCRELLAETMKAYAEPVSNEESLFLIVAHTFAYSKLVHGLDPLLPLLKEMFWLSTSMLESPYPIEFEGALIFMTNCLNKLYPIHFLDDSNKKNLPSVLMNSRGFAREQLKEIETYHGSQWSTDNFPHIVTSFIIRGMSIPVVKGTALECLRSLFSNAYKEHDRNEENRHHLVYLFLLYLLYASESFEEMLHELKLDSDMVELDATHKVPKTLLDWVSADKDCPNICLYQSALLFDSSMSDEPCKYRFTLVVRYLLQRNPICAFRIYSTMRVELRRISNLEQTSESVLISFDIINLLLSHGEFEELVEFGRETEARVAARGLKLSVAFESCEVYYTHTAAPKNEDAELIYNRKRLMTMILARMTRYTTA
ncbi:GTPase-activating protein IRA1 KNAG_0K01960 [Huiozyma naganishii CBS 8797]|uniref:Ras-GAP domain-containing protein n=1 Tax=Huiozyma naganishii (strain ATCC MYA-139 / BCRC 22969 / CBS 8797 / KCTC 17520 / NBRC 10181 / NCYC 3082 / Yp74L-3) TaxID=1071383 RepID=J7RCH0_HUIN7|nr:hypothetical protein KNAG_0K01960 [Kazachstania naganishii CBS 8797]CCK72560.1 hypothetical protein KNAG_0K01960 [Kazachstania naganishii CBS 8797]